MEKGGPVRGRGADRLPPLPPAGPTEPFGFAGHTPRAIDIPAHLRDQAMPSRRAARNAERAAEDAGQRGEPDRSSPAAEPGSGPGGGRPDPEAPAESAAARVLRLARKASWNVIDQALSAVTNAALFFLAARSVSTSELDAFSTSFYLFSLLIGIQRALVGQVLGIRFSDATGAQLASALRRSFGTVLALTLTGAAAMIGAGIVLGGTLGSTLIATAVVMPALIGQDTCRMAFFAMSKAKLAAFNDALWAVIQFSAIGALVWADRISTPALVLAWGGAAAVCVVVALAQLRVVPQLGGTLSWLRETKDLSGFLVGEYLLTAGAFNGGFLVVGAIVGEGAVSSIRGAQVLLGPLGILSSAVVTFALPELSRRAWLSAATRWKVAVVAATGMTVISLAYTLVLVLLPHDVGTFLFGESWDGARSVFLPVALGSTAAGTTLGPAIVIYAMGQARRTFRIMLFEAPLVFALLIGGALVDGAVGAAWGLALDQALLIPVWFLLLRVVLRPPAPPSGRPRGRRATGTPPRPSRRAVPRHARPFAPLTT